MGVISRRVATIGIGLVLGLGGLTGVAFATDEPPAPSPGHSGSRCNSGNGNGSEAAGPNCIGGDPGRSFAAGNRGGDEGGTPVPNPGGNNVP